MFDIKSRSYLIKQLILKLTAPIRIKQ